MSIIYYHTMPAFEHYFRPKTVKQAVFLLNRYGGEARILAGGTDLLVSMRARNIVPKCIVDINRIPKLDYIGYDKKTNALMIGALATLRAVELSRIVKEEFIILYEAIQQMASTQVRNMGTVVGNICRASPAADTAPPLLILKAEVEIAAPEAKRMVPIEDFFTGPGTTVLQQNEMVTGIKVPKLPSSVGASFLRVTRVAADLAKVSAACVLIIKDGVCKEARIALGGVAPTPIRARRTEKLLSGKKLETGLIEEAGRLAAEESRPIDDVRSTREYRKEMSRVLVSRTIKISLERARKAVG